MSEYSDKATEDYYKTDRKHSIEDFWIWMKELVDVEDSIEIPCPDEREGCCVLHYMTVIHRKPRATLYLKTNSKPRFETP